MRARNDLRLPFTGYAWSDTIGWISLAGANYGLQMGSDGAITGHAWSDNIGWIQAGGLSGFPSGSGTVAGNAQLTGTTDITGWLKALAGDTPQSGDWDGWISLGGTSPAYGVTRSAATGDLSGYAWGDTNLGWISFAFGNAATSAHRALSTAVPVQTVLRTDTDSECTFTTTDHTTCDTPSFCSAGSSICLMPPITFIQSGSNTGHLQIRPQLVRKGGTTKVFWNVDNVESCTVTSPNDSWTADSSGPSGQTSNPIYQQTVFTLSCTGLDGSNIHETATVGVVPVFQEI